MEVDINEPKSKAFNVFLRSFQLASQLIIAYWALWNDGLTDCDFSNPTIISYIAYALLVVNLLTIIRIRCSDGFPRTLFFGIFALNLLMAIGIIVVNAIHGFKGSAAERIFYHFSIIETVITLFIVFITLAMRLVWGQRYSNSPGNLVWAPLFLVNSWSASFLIEMRIIGVAAVGISLLTLILNVISLFNTSLVSRKLVTGGWILGIVVLLILEGLAIFKYVATGSSNLQYIDSYARKTLIVFIGVNALDVLFWMWGMKTLDHEKGDPIRGELFQGRSEKRRMSEVVEKSIFVSNSMKHI